MEKHGVTFRDYACASANLAGGMGLDQVCSILSVEEPLWAEVQEFWNNKMAELSDDDMAFYGEVFTNPKQGRFANIEGAAAGPEAVLAKYPEWTDYIKMGSYMAAVSDVGIDIDFDKEFGISITEFSQLGSHWSAFYKEKVVDRVEGDEEASRIFELQDELKDKWDEFYQKKYKGQGADISDDIDF